MDNFTKKKLYTLLFLFNSFLISGPIGHGNFTTKSASSLLTTNIASHSRSTLLKKMWKTPIPPKIKVFTWQLIRGRLQTRDLIHTNLVINQNCPFCQNSLEDLNHLFFLCPFSSAVWQHSGISFHSSNFNNSFFSWIDSISSNQTVFSKVLFIYYYIWRARNYLIFKNNNTEPIQVAYVAAIILWVYIPSSTVSNHVFTSRTIKWSPPPSDFIKLNFDGSVFQNSQAAAGFIIRNDKGIHIVASAKHLGYSNILCAEAFALRAGLLVASLHQFFKIKVEGDSKVLIDCLNNRTNIPWRISTFMISRSLLVNFTLLNSVIFGVRQILLLMPWLILDNRLMLVTGAPTSQLWFLNSF